MAHKKKEEANKTNRPDHYEKPLVIEGTFLDVIRVAVKSTSEQEPSPPKPNHPKKK